MDLGQTIEHLRGNHGPIFIRRPSALGVSDTRGLVWYCFYCSGKLKDHRSFGSDRAMWDHLNICHNAALDDLVLE